MFKLIIHFLILFISILIQFIFSYYDQLCALESKIPMHELRDVPFKWKSAFERKMFKGRISLSE